MEELNGAANAEGEKDMFCQDGLAGGEGQVGQPVPVPSVNDDRGSGSKSKWSHCVKLY